MKKNKRFTRFFVLYIFAGAFFALFLARLFYLQIFCATDAQSTITARLSLSVRDPAPRGEIKDRNNTTLAGNRKGYFVLIKKGDDANLALTVKNLAAYSGISYEELLNQMKAQDFGGSNPFVFCEDADADIITKINESPEKYPCAQIITKPVREYFYPETAAHLMGRCGIIDKKEYEQNPGYSRDDYIGKQGAEKVFEHILRGTDGQRAQEKYVGATSQTFTQDIPPVAGKNVILTIDLPLQKKVEEALSATVNENAGATGGAFVVTDVNSGEILALASNPTYNIAEFSKNYTALSQNPNMPFFNRSIAGLYEPGSTFKPITAIAAMESGNLSPAETIKTKGEYKYYDRTFRCNIFRQTGKNHGTIDVSQALGVSCNYFFYELGHRTGIDKIAKTAESFGLGSPTGIELTNEEAKGIIATPENRTLRGGYWYAGDTLQASIGQSDNLFTPLALANYAAALGNGGTLYRAHILKGIEEHTGAVEYTPVQILNRIKMSNQTQSAIHRGMLYVTQKGTAAPIFSDFPVAVAGKTGSAQLSRHTNGLFIGYAPADNPKIAFCAVVEGANSGNVAANLTKEVLAFYFNIEQEGNRYD